MATKKHPKQEPKLVAKDEVDYISGRYHIPIAKVRQAMKIAGKDGKPSRSRANIYKVLRAEPYNYKIPLRIKKTSK